MTSELSSLYKNRRIALWVEDPITRTWLHTLWQDPDIGLLVAGGNDAVHAAVNDARRESHLNVFGFRDRDFLADNQANWLQPDKDPPVFIPAAFEIENFMLDFVGLASLGRSWNPRGRTAQDLKKRAFDRAKDSLWWMAARSTVADARLAVTHCFPTHPKLGNPCLASKSDAQAVLEDKLLTSSWGASLPGWVRQLDSTWIDTRLTRHARALDAALESDAWRWLWAGKEILNHVAGYIDCKPADLAKGLADHQRRTGTVDKALADLRVALRKRAGVDPW